MEINKKIPVFDFKLGDKEKEYVNDCLETSFIGQGSYVKDFEEKFSKKMKSSNHPILPSLFKSSPYDKFQLNLI